MVGSAVVEMGASSMRKTISASSRQPKTHIPGPREDYQNYLDWLKSNPPMVKVGRFYISEGLMFATVCVLAALVVPLIIAALG